MHLSVIGLRQQRRQSFSVTAFDIVVLYVLLIVASDSLRFIFVLGYKH